MRVEVRGAPRDQGIEQGERLCEQVRSAVRERLSALGPLARARLRRRTRRGAGLALARFLPQHHERLAGIAAGTGVRQRDLEILEAAPSPLVRARLVGSVVEAAIDFDRAIVRASAPDAGGFASVELTLAPWAGALAGVNAEGIAALSLGQPPTGDAPPARWLVQEVLLRARAFDDALEHVRRRARYLGATGALLVLDTRGRAARIELAAGAARIERDPALRPEERLQDRAAELAIDATARTLRWRDLAGAPPALSASADPFTPVCAARAGE
jgi:hypothetical protein